MAHTIHGPDEKLIAKDKKQRLKERKLEHQQFLSRAQGRRAYWELTLEQNAGIIKAINLKIAALTARREKLLAELQAAPREIKMWQAECDRLATMTGDKDGQKDKLMQKFLKLQKQVDSIKADLSDLKLSEEEIALLAQASKKASVAHA